MDQNQKENQNTLPTNRRQKQIALRPITIILFLTLNLIVLMMIGYPYLQDRYHLPFEMPVDFQGVDDHSDPTSETASGIIITSSNEIAPTTTPKEMPSITPFATLKSSESELWYEGFIVLALQDGLDTHLFTYQPIGRMDRSSHPFNRLTSGSWKDITPALSPNNDKLAFASNRSGIWELYLMDMENGQVVALTDSPEYDASPSWSPDGLWIVYESYYEDNLEIFIRPVDESQEPIQLTTHYAADYAPAWSPLGRQIAFVSTREGKRQIWLANLDESGEDRFVCLSQHIEASAGYPVWSPDGRYLAWGAVTTGGFHHIYIWDRLNPDNPPRENGSGDWAVWSPDGNALLSVLKTPYYSYLTAYQLDEAGTIILPPVKLPGTVSGLMWSDGEINESLAAAGGPTPTPFWEIELQSDIEVTNGRWDIIPLEDVDAPYPRLHDLVDDSFHAMRKELTSQVGWDLMANLDNAFLPLSSALSPGLMEDWLYTGRAFALNTLPINAGWMTVIREDFGMETYWRIFLRARYQDGSQGQPLYDLPWNFNSRYSGQPVAYDQGGELSPAIPRGYWVDLTQLASMYGWERLPALSNWQAAYSSARFNEFVKTDGLDWFNAMLEIYPDSVLLTLTPVPTATPSPTPAPLWFKSPTLTMTLIPSQTASPTPTPSGTPTATQSSQPSSTRTPTSTP